MMAQATGDTRTLLAQPIDYDRFVEATEPTTWRGQLERYLRFLPQLGWAAVATVQISVLSMVIAVAVSKPEFMYAEYACAVWWSTKQATRGRRKRMRPRVSSAATMRAP